MELKNIDFSKYKIYIPKMGGAASLYGQGKDLHLLDNNCILPFDVGIKILQEEKRAMYLSDDLSNPGMSEYFEKEFGVWAV